MIIKTHSLPIRTAQKRHRVLTEITEFIGRHNLQSAEECIDRLMAALPNKDCLAENVVMVPYGGGKDSTFVVALARYAQLATYREMQDTFLLRCVTNFQAGMAYGVIDNIARVYKALGLLDDPMAELLIVEGNRVRDFAADYKMPKNLLTANRLDVLMNGHLSRASNRATFCNACNFSMARSFVLGLQYGRPASIVITGDSPFEQRKYFFAIQRMAHEMRVERNSGSHDFGPFMQTVDRIDEQYQRFVFGPDSPEVKRLKDSTTPLSSQPHFFSIFED